MEIAKLISAYIDYLLDYNQKINLVSRQMTRPGIQQLIEESLLLLQYLSPRYRTLIDAGSGNGLLGFPIAFSVPQKKIVLVEPKPKKALFLQTAKEFLQLENIEVVNASIEEYLKKSKKYPRALFARGFPDFGVFIRFLKNGSINEAVLITSDNKIKKNEQHLESVCKKTYNVPLRENLKILKMENAARD